VRSPKSTDRSAHPTVTNEKGTDVVLAALDGTLNLVGYGLSAIGPGIGVGLIFAAYVSGVARQPESRNLLQPIAILGFALAEALALFGLVLAFVL
jgi:F-type H+-transporting ATPase subunit c